MDELSRLLPGCSQTQRTVRMDNFQAEMFNYKHLPETQRQIFERVTLLVPEKCNEHRVRLPDFVWN